MKTKTAAKLINEYGFELLRWNGSFTEATAKRSSGEIVSIPTAGGRAKVVARLELLKAPRVAAAPGAVTAETPAAPQTE